MTYIDLPGVSLGANPPAAFTRPILFGILVLFFGIGLWKLRKRIRRLHYTKLANLPGPPNPSWIFGNQKILGEEANSVPQERWVKEYKSSTLMYRGLLSVGVAVQFVLH